MACKTSFFLLNKKKPVLSNWPHLNVRRQNFDFHLSNTVVAVDLFVIAAAAVVVHVVVAVGKDIHE